MRQWRAECLEASYCYSRSSPQYWNLVFASPKLARGACRRAGSQRARINDRADGELPLQDSNLDYLIQSSPVGACLEGTMSASGDLPSIGAPAVGEKCPDRSGETLVKCLQRLCASPPDG